MGAVMFCAAVAILGIDVGWQRLPDGGLEYIIQIEPQTLDALRSGQAIESDIPSNISDIRSYRIVVGSKKLPRDLPPPRTNAVVPTPSTVPELPPTVPQTLLPDPATKLLPEQPAVFQEPASAPPVVSASDAANETQPETPNRPWLPLTFTLLGLFASVGGNVFLGWVLLDLRKRCQTLLGQQHGP